MHDPSHFDLHALEAAVAATEFAGHVQHLPTATSTNDLALAAAKAGVRNGVWVADEQTEGRGRGGHAWHSTPGDGLYLSALITPIVPTEDALHLSMITAIAVQAAISSVFGFRSREQIDIRWPNDLILNWRKVGGILIETSAGPATSHSSTTGLSMLRFAVLGIGINLNHAEFPPELDGIATSIRRELGHQGEPLRRERLAGAILVALDQEIRQMVRNWQEPDTAVKRDLTAYSSWIQGKHVRVLKNDVEGSGYTGVTAGLDPQGYLMVNGDDGQAHMVLSGGLREPFS